MNMNGKELFRSFANLTTSGMCSVKSHCRAVTSMSTIASQYSLSLLKAVGSLSIKRQRILGDLPREVRSVRMDLKTSIARANEVSFKLGSTDFQGPAGQAMYVMSEAQAPTMGKKADRYRRRISCFTAVCSRSS